MSGSRVSTHVLDTALGRPAADVGVILEAWGSGGWSELAAGRTGANGRVEDLGPASAPAGTYRLRFDTGAYFAAAGTPAFFPEVTLTFAIVDDGEHYHVPLLISPFAYSTYRGN